MINCSHRLDSVTLLLNLCHSLKAGQALCLLEFVNKFSEKNFVLNKSINGWKILSKCICFKLFILNYFSNLCFHSLCQDLLFQCRFLFAFFLWYFKQTVILIIYSFFCFTAWWLSVNDSGAAVFNILPTNKSFGNTLFLSTLPTR